MDIATLLGLFGAVGLMLMAIFYSGVAFTFLDVPSVLIVLGGSLFVVLMRFSWRQFLGAMRVATQAFLMKHEAPEKIIQEVVALAQLARKKGLLELEKKGIEHPYLKMGLFLVIDGLDPQRVRLILNKELAQTMERHEVGQRIFRALADVSPAMGMIGTLIGLVQMLSGLPDPSLIGPAMAITILTTLYGAVIANVIALPIADKLQLRSDEERRRKLMICDGVLAIQGGVHPRIIEDTLKSYLPKDKRESMKKFHSGR